MFCIMFNIYIFNLFKEPFNVEEAGKCKASPYAAMPVKGGAYFIKNKIFSYSMDETWGDILKDLLEDSNFVFGKADTADVCLSA